MNQHNDDDKKEAIPANDQELSGKSPEAAQNDEGNQTTSMVEWVSPASIIDPFAGNGAALLEQHRAVVALSSNDDPSLAYKLAWGAAGVVLGGLLVRRIMSK